MPKTLLVFFKDDDGSVPVLDWLDELPEKALDKCTVKLERLQELGHELRRPEAEYLRDGIYELRTHFQSANYRILYFFHGREIAVLAHAITKQHAAVPEKEIKLAIKRKRQYEENPKAHQHEE